MKINNSNFIFIKLQRMKKCRATSAVLADGVKAPLSPTSRRKTKLKQLTTGIIIKLFQSIWNAIHQTREGGSTDLIREPRCAAKKKRNV